MIPPDAIRVATGAQISDLVCRHRYTYNSEEELQQSIARVFAANGVSFEREYILSPQDRVDFFVTGIAVEVKIHSPLASVVRQLSRYAASNEVTEIVLVTTKANHMRVPATINGKTVTIAALWRTL